MYYQKKGHQEKCGIKVTHLLNPVKAPEPGATVWKPVILPPDPETTPPMPVPIHTGMFIDLLCLY